MLKSTPVRILLAVLALAFLAVAAIVVLDIDVLALIPEPETAQQAPAADAPAVADAPAADASGADAPAADASGADEPAPAAAAGGEAQAADGALTFTIDPSASEARFFVNEVLLGVPTEVKGVTSLISGTVTVDPANPAQSQVGAISVDASDLRTDRNLRNRAIRRFILESGRDEYQFITFTPTAISGLPEQAAPGDTFTFQVTGDLKIKDITQPVTFDVELTADSATQISGLAQAVVKRSDYNLEIPSAPGVADVTDEVRLELAFTALADEG
jgi:polyisoprenoid-binding protein YceI